MAIIADNYLYFVEGIEMKTAEFSLIVSLIVLTLLAVFLLIPSGVLAAAEIVTLRLMQLAVLLVAFFATVFCLHGTKYDVLQEVFEEDNIAAAIFVSALLLAMAGVVGK